MKISPGSLVPGQGRFGLRLLFLSVALMCMRSPLHAELPAPDNILYGTITLASRTLTAADSNVVVEARRTAGGAVLASYRLGSDAGLGGFYRLKIPLEELAPASDSPEASVVGDSLVLVVRNQSGVQLQLPYQIPERGHAQRLDFGTGVLDSDNDGLPDAWELAIFGNLGQNGTGDPDGDGVNNLGEFTTGTNPADGTGVFRLSIARSGPVNRLVSFFAVTASGAGYTGYDRIYTLESTTNLALGNWRGVPNYTNVLGNNTTVSYLSSEADAQTFYRCRAQLRTR